MHGAARQDRIDLFLCVKETHLRRCIICQVKPSHVSCSSPGGAPYTNNALLISNFFRDMNLRGRTRENNLLASSGRVAVLQRG